MTTYESEIKTISSSEEMVFGILSDLKNLEKIAQNPSLKDKVKNLEFYTDSCSFSVEGFGTVGFRIIEREPFKTIKLESEIDDLVFELYGITVEERKTIEKALEG